MKRLLSLLCLLLSTLSAGAVQPNWSAGVSYVYDGSGNIRSIGGEAQVYDAAGRLVQSAVNSVQSNFEYDGFGNRTKCARPGTDCQPGDVPSKLTNRLSLAT